MAEKERPEAYPRRGKASVWWYIKDADSEKPWRIEIIYFVADHPRFPRGAEAKQRVLTACNERERDMLIGLFAGQRMCPGRNAWRRPKTIDRQKRKPDKVVELDIWLALFASDFQRKKNRKKIVPAARRGLCYN